MLVLAAPPETAPGKGAAARVDPPAPSPRKSSFSPPRFAMAMSGV